MDTNQERLLRRLRESSFTSVSARVDGLAFERRGPNATPADEDSPPAAELLTLRCPGPGIVSLLVGPGDLVRAGTTVATVQMHRTTLTLEVDTAGVVGQLHLGEGDFAGYGEPLLTITRAN